MRDGPGSRERLLAFFLNNIGRVIDHEELQVASGDASEWARRVRELRDEFGYQILTCRDRADLKPGQYLLETNKRLPVLPRSISKETRAYILDRNGYTCQSCGASAGDPDPYCPTRPVRLTIGHIVDKSKSGSDERSNLRAFCSNCNEGLHNTSLPKPSWVDLKTQVRRATVDDQTRLLAWLQSKFAKGSTP